ncbi:MAG: hypothetical protein Q4C58_07575 [Eubacteriales bacterium]|nr:hypothetical protein [Eubacteriales bacterium]
MKPLEIVSRMCDVINELYDIVREQQREIERSNIPVSTRKEFHQKICSASDKLDVLEYQSRGMIDVDDGTPMSEKISLYNATVITEHRLQVEATSRKEAAKRAKEEFEAMTHIAPKRIVLRGAKKGETE